MTFKELAQTQGIKLDSIRRNLRRKNIEVKVSANAEVPPEVLEIYGPAIPPAAEVLQPAPYPASEEPTPAGPPSETTPPAPPPPAALVEAKRQPRTKQKLPPEYFKPRTVNGHAQDNPADNPADLDLLSAVFGSKLAIMSAAFVLVTLGGYAFAGVASAVLDDTSAATLAFFGLSGAVVHYVGLLNAYRQSLKATQFNNPAEPWIWGFAMFECLLHACNFDAFGPYNFGISVFILSISLPLATAGLAIVLLIRR